MRRKVLIVRALLLLAGVGLEIYGYCTYVRPMQNQKRYSMNPLTRQVFDLDYPEVEYIRVLNKNDRYLEWRQLEDEESIKEITELLNSFRYIIWTPAPDYRHIMIPGDDYYHITLSFGMRENYDLEWLRISMQENRIRVGGLWLYGLPSFHKTCMNDL